MIADSWIEIEQFRLLVLQTAWKIDKYNDYQKVRGDISAVKVAMPKVLHDVAARAVQVHGSLGVSDEMPLAAMVLESFHMGLADGATEVHQITLARQLLKEYKGTDGLFPTTHLPRLRAAAEESTPTPWLATAVPRSSTTVTIADAAAWPPTRDDRGRRRADPARSTPSCGTGRRCTGHRSTSGT